MKITSRASTLISLVLAIAAFFMLVAAIFLMPYLMELYFKAVERDLACLKPTLIILYIATAPAFLADASLILLLKKILSHEMFTPHSVMYLRVISWCCFAESIIFLFLMKYFLSAGAIVFATAFMGIIVRVVKNVIEEAVEIKDENDFTI